MFENMRFVILFDMLFNPSFKMATSFANVARTTASTSTYWLTSMGAQKNVHKK